MPNGACSSNDGEKRVEFVRVGGLFLNVTAESAIQSISAHSMEKKKH
jgi:hypothetical protein